MIQVAPRRRSPAPGSGSSRHDSSSYYPLPGTSQPSSLLPTPNTSRPAAPAVAGGSHFRRLEAFEFTSKAQGVPASRTGWALVTSLSKNIVTCLDGLINLKQLFKFAGVDHKSAAEWYQARNGQLGTCLTIRQGQFLFLSRRLVTLHANEVIDVWLNPQACMTIARRLDVFTILAPLIYAAVRSDDYAPYVIFKCERCMTCSTSLLTFKRLHAATCGWTPILCFCGRCLESEEAYKSHQEGCSMYQQYLNGLSTWELHKPVTPLTIVVFITVVSFFLGGEF